MNPKIPDRARHGLSCATLPRENDGGSMAMATQYAALAVAEQHVAEGDRRLVRQRERIDRLRSGGHDLQPALRMLQRLEDTQRSHVAKRARLIAELFRD